ncbi:MAG: hypothetical protein WB783_11885 [Arenicellales bacterium]|jgi:hypothetical protein
MHRILIWSRLPVSDGATPDVVLDPSEGCAGDANEDRLAVADTDNNRAQIRRWWI